MKIEFKIKGELSDYYVDWEPRGWSYAVPIVKKEVKLFGFFPHKKFLWRGPSKPHIHAEKLHPKEIIEWYTRAVQEYEEYVKAWSSSEQKEMKD
jgi:hypothetical protein